MVRKLYIALALFCVTALSAQLPAEEYVSASKKGHSTIVASPVWYSTSHEGAYHSAVFINDNYSLFEGTVELEDGSIWVIWHEDMYKTLNWLTSDLIVITRNHSLFSSYDFKLTNQNTGVSILANLHKDYGPLVDSPHRRWILAIDDYSNVVYLDDGSAWSISYFDASTIYQWRVGETVIIGVNDSFLNPNFLLNVEAMTYASGKAY